jgi:hypothetical protein
MGGACSMNWREEERIQIVGGKARGKETASRKTQDIGGWIILGRCGLDWCGSG